MQKPKPRVYWTNRHSVYDEAGVVVIGRVVVPVSIILIFSAIITVVLAVYGFVNAEWNDRANITDWNAIGFLPLGIWLSCVVGFWVVVGLVQLVKWVVRAIKEAPEGLDKSRWS